MTIRKIMLSLVAVLMVLMATNAAPRKNQAYEDYIKKYRSLAVDEMKKYHIPASITLAQGLLESGAGKSALARRSNNHFGIKCGKGWHGKTVRYDDDRRNECFRAYKHPKYSYEDHSKFLRTGARYAFLFRLKITDYKGWARGLKKAGYATDPHYANRLIDIIELYELYRYDRKGGLKHVEKYPDPHQPYMANGLLYVIARKGDTFKSLSDELDISSKKLRSYNELPKDFAFEGGEIVYLEEKNKKANKDYVAYVVQNGDSMHSIAQKFGIRLKYLYKMNKMKADAPAPNVGDIMRLR